MHRTAIVRSFSALAAVLAMAACTPASDTEGTTAAPAPVASAVDAVTGPAGNDAATVEACTAIAKDIKENAKKVAEAEKIGPPAGHIAVSAQWIAGSASITEHSLNANETVSKAAEDVQKEMMTLSDEYNKSAKAKPSKENLDAAVANLTKACATA